MTHQAPATRLAGTVLAALGAAAMTFAGLMKVFNTDFRGDMADNYQLFGAELPVWFFVMVGLAELQQDVVFSTTSGPWGTIWEPRLPSSGRTAGTANWSS